MKDSFYFPHDMDAHSDPKIMELLGVGGLAGLGFYWIIIEILHQQKDGKITQDAFKQYLNFYFKLENAGTQLPANVEQVLNKTKLLLTDDNGMMYSARVLDNKKYRENISMKRSEAGKKSAEKRANPTSVEQNLTSDEQGKERKGKEKKRKERKYNISSNEESTPSHKAKDFFDLVLAKNDQYQEFCFRISEAKNLAPALVQSELQKFTLYWTEISSNGKKQRWEDQKFFEVQKRLGSWFSKLNTFQNPIVGKPKGRIIS